MVCSKRLTARRSALRPSDRLGVAALVALPMMLLAVGQAEAAVVPAELVARAGDVPLGSVLPIGSTRPPFVLVDGSVAFVGLLDDGDAYVFIDDEVVWQGSNEVMSILSTTESSMGAAAGGVFVYSPLVDGNDAVWTHNGLLALEGDQAPLFPAGVVTTFHSRPLMPASGTPYWIAGINANGGMSTEERVLYRSPTAMPGDIEVVLAAGSMVGGLLVESLGIDFDYEVSPDDSHRIHVLLLETGSNTNDAHVVVDGALLHQEDTPNGTGDNWDNFDLVTINNQGLYVMSGDTNGATTSDEFVAVGGTIAVREGDMVGGIMLNSSASVRMISVNDSGRIIHAWGYDGVETVFYACDETDVAGSSIPVITTGVDELDLDGDGIADALITDLEANTLSGSRALSDDEVVYLELEIDDGMGPREVIVRVPVSCCGNAMLDDGEECDDGNGDDTDACPGTCTNATCGDGFAWAGMEECDDGNPADTDACLTGCVAATCGDGFLWAGVEECDDDNVDDTDDCPSNCMLAECGDGFVWAGVEQCDDGNDDDTDACLRGCIAATCGDGIVQAGVEECDDVNDDDTDACPGNCQDAECGDGFVQAGAEECDDGNDDDADGCTNACAIGEVGGSSGEPSDDSGSETGEPPGTTSGDGTGSSGGLDGTAGSDGGSTSPPVSSAGSTSEGSTVDTDTAPLGGLDDDGGCTCRSAATQPLGGALGPLMLLVLGLRRRRD